MRISDRAVRVIIAFMLIYWFFWMLSIFRMIGRCEGRGLRGQMNGLAIECAR